VVHKGWAVRADYVGFLQTSAYEGYKRAPDACPECGTPLEPVEGSMRDITVAVVKE
jgi:hypothetical protein